MTSSATEGKLPLASIMDTLEHSFKKAVASQPQGFPPVPDDFSEGSDTSSDQANAGRFATEEQHMTLRTLTWFLSKTNSGLGNIATAQISPAVNQARNRYQRVLYDKLESLAVLLERHHESISIVPSDRNATRAFISRSYSSPPPAAFDHIDLDEETLTQFEPALGLSGLTFSEKNSADKEQRQNEEPFCAGLFKAQPNDYPVLSRYSSDESPLSYGHYLLRHTKGQVDKQTFITDISFREHCGNVVDAIKRTHQQGLSQNDMLTSHDSLSHYVYFSSIVSIQDRMNRGFFDYDYGKYLTLSGAQITLHDVTARDLPFKCGTNNSETCGLEKSKIGPQQKKLIQFLLETLDQYGVRHFHLRHGCPESLSEREHFYDKTGRFMFHTLLASVLSGLNHHINGLAHAKRTAMETQISLSENSQTKRNVGNSDTFLNGLHNCYVQETQKVAFDVGFHTARTGTYFQMLDIIRSDFNEFLSAHLTWIASIFEQSYQSDASNAVSFATRPDGLFDEFAPLSKDISDSAWKSSCLHWLRLLCLQETSMKALRRPVVAGFKDRVLSEHIARSKVSCITVSTSSRPRLMKPVKQWLREETFDESQVNDVLQWLVHAEKLPNGEAVNREQFTGCLHTQAMQIVLMCLGAPKKLQYMQKERNLWHEGTTLDLGGLPAGLPRESLTAKVSGGRNLMVTSNKPFCAACQVVVQQGILRHGSSARHVCHRGNRMEWSQFDLPPWTPRDIIRGVLREAQRVASLRILRIVDIARSQRGETGAPSFLLEDLTDDSDPSTSSDLTPSSPDNETLAIAKKRTFEEGSTLTTCEENKRKRDSQAYDDARLSTVKQDKMDLDEAAFDQADGFTTSWVTFVGTGSREQEKHDRVSERQ